MSPVTGRLDAFVWQAPPDVLAGPHIPMDDVTADLDEVGVVTPALAAPEPTLMPEPASEPLTVQVAAPEPPTVAPAPTAAAAHVPVPASRSTVEPPHPAPPTGDADQGAAAAAPARAKPNGAHPPVAEPLAPVTFPVEHAPDDPGPEKEPDEKRSRFRLFG
jgi:HemY protein